MTMRSSINVKPDSSILPSALIFLSLWYVAIIAFLPFFNTVTPTLGTTRILEV